VATTAVVAAAFGIDRLAVVVHRFYVEHHHTPARATGAINQVTATTATTVPGAPRCGGPQLSAIVSDWRETNGTVEETVALTNISMTPCALAGWATLDVGAQNGTPLPATNADVASIGSPGTAVPVGTTVPPSPITLAQGAGASFQLSYASTCDQVLQPGQPATLAPNQCYSGIWLEVTPTPGSSPLVVTEPLRLTYATTGFQVGPFQAGGGPPLPGQPPLTAQTTSPTGPSTTQ